MRSSLSALRGVGVFTFFDRLAGRRGSMDVHYCIPEKYDPAKTPMIALHGLDRAAAGFRDVFREAAARSGRIVLVPEFDAQAFPGVFAFNYGNAVNPPPDGTFNPRSAWNYPLLENLFRFIREVIPSDAATFDLYGNSAGAQYVLRCVALAAPTALRRAIVSNSGVYMLPDLEAAYPAGLGGLGLRRVEIERYFRSNIHILLGEADIDAAAHDLPRTPEALAQGPHRLARGLWYYDHCRRLAAELDVDFAWKVETVPQAGHISQAIFDRAVALLD